MKFNISNKQDQIKAILLYCKKYKVKIDRSKFKIVDNNLYYDVYEINKWYHFFDKIKVWSCTEEGYSYWYNHQLQLAYFALHFQISETTKYNIMYYISDLFARSYNECDIIIKDNFLRMCHENKLIDKIYIKLWHAKKIF